MRKRAKKESRNKSVITIKEDTRLSGTDSILEKGDQIGLISKKRAKNLV